MAEDSTGNHAKGDSLLSKEKSASGVGSSGSVSRVEAGADVLFVVLLAAGYVSAELAGIQKRWIFICLGLALLLYGVIIWRRGRETWRDFGVRTDNLAGCLMPTVVWTLLAAAAIVIWAYASGRPLWRPESAILLPVYPLYGIAQQFIFQGVIHRRMMVLTNNRLLAVSATAVLFSLVHIGDWRLVGLTFVAGAIWSLIFQKRRK